MAALATIFLNPWFCLNTDWKSEEESVKSPREKHLEILMLILRLEELAFCRTRGKTELLAALLRTGKVKTENYQCAVR